MKKPGIIVLCVFMVLLSVPLTSCTKQISESAAVNNLTDIDENKVVYGASSLGAFKSISEHGIFYHDADRLKYYDFETEESYVLCSRSNCRHSDLSCSGWYESAYSASGLALYGKNVYVLKVNESKNSYDLVSMDITGNNQKTVCSFSTGDYGETGWFLVSVHDICYVGGMAWFRATYAYSYGINNEQTNHEHRTADSVIGVNLSDGKYIVINKPPENDKEMTPVLYADCSIEYISKDYVMISRGRYTSEKLTEEEFMKELAAGRWSEFRNSEDPYYAYLEWYSNYEEYVYSYLLYDVQRDSLKELEKGILFPDYYEGSIEGMTLLFPGSYENKILLSAYDLSSDVNDRESGTPVFAYDPKTDKTELVLEIERGSLLITEDTGFGAYCVLDSEKLLYCIFKDDGKADICTYNLRTKEHTKLYEDDAGITFRIIGETNGKYIGHKVNFSSETYALCSISKEDYMKGNLGAAEKLF